MSYTCPVDESDFGNQDSDKVFIEFTELLKETEKAVHIKLDTRPEYHGESAWFPKSQITDLSFNTMTLYVPGWLDVKKQKEAARKHGVYSEDFLDALKEFLEDRYEDFPIVAGKPISIIHNDMHLLIDTNEGWQ